MMMNGLILDDNMSNLTSASNEASISSSNRNEVGSLYPQQQSFASPNQPPLAKKKRNLPGNPDPEAEVMALSPKTLMATNRFICEICNKGFQRDQNLQLHRRGHNLPWKLKQRANKEVIKKKVYVCPEPTCVHHDPSRALGDLTGIKKHFSRKHGEKKWKCEKCSKRYAVQSDWKAHSKICGTREYRCDCGTLFSRRDSFITHRAFCDALAEESARSITLANHPLLSSSQPPITSSSHFNHHLQNHHLHNPPTLQPFPLMKREQQDQSFNNLIRPPPELPPWLACQPLVGEGGAPPPIDLSTQLFSSRLDQHQHQHHHSFIHHNENPNPSTSLSTTTTTPSLPSFQPTSSPHMSATALLQKAAQMGVTMSKPCPSESLILNRPHKAHHMSCSSTSLASSTAGSGLDLSSREEMEISGFSQSLASFGNKAVVTSGYMEQVGATMVGSSLPCGSGFEGSSSFEEALNGMLNPRMESHFQETFSKPAAMETHLRRSNEGGGVGGGNDGLTRDFLGLRTISHRGFPNMAGLDHMNSPSSSYDQQNQNQTPWQVRMQRGGWIPVLKHRGKPVAGRNMVSSEIYTVFVDNIPYSLDPKGLFNLFRKFGVVKDVFIPQKRRRITNTRFGFVRFSCEVAAQVAVQKAHGLWVDDKKLGVKFAEFERNKEHGQTHIQPPNRSKYRAEDRRGPNPFTNQKSFAEAVKGTKELRSGSVSIKAEEFGNGWLYSSVLVRLKARFINISLKIELEEKGIEGIAVRKCGGRDVLLSFQTKEEREIKMKAIKNIIEDWCELLIPWQPDLVLEPERLVWITCFGVPLQLWNRSNFIKIGSLWGEVLEGEEGVPQSFDCGKLRIITKCMEPINKVIHLESNQLSYPVRVLEDQIVVSKNFKQCCRCSTPQDVEEHHSSNEVRGSEVKFDFFRDAEPSQNHVDELTRHFGGESALGNAQTKMEARGKKPRGEVSVAEADKGELCRSDTAVAETCSMIGKELEAETCKAMVAVSSAFNGIRAAAQGQDGQVYTPGFMRSLSGSSLKRPGLNLEVVLGHHKLNSDLVDLYKGPNGPVFDESHINGMAMNVGPAIRESSVSQTKTQEANKISKSAALNSKGKEQAKGKRRTSYIRPQKGLLGLEKKAGLKGASTSKSVPQRSLFRASVAEASLLALTEKGGEGSQHLLDEAQACLQMGKLLGVDMLGKEKEVLNKIVELEVKDICRMDRGKDAVE